MPDLVCISCDGQGGYLVNPDWPMGDCGDREWHDCGECERRATKEEKQAIFRDHLLVYNHHRFGSPLPERLKT